MMVFSSSPSFSSLAMSRPIARSVLSMVPL